MHLVGVGLLGAFIGKGEGRGKILAALDHPVISRTVETFEYGRKGSAAEGLVIEHTTKVKEFTVGDILALLIAGGILYVASEGPVREFLKNAIDPLDLFDDGIIPDDPGFWEAVANAFENALDPLGLFE